MLVVLFNAERLLLKLLLFLLLKVFASEENDRET